MTTNIHADLRVQILEKDKEVDLGVRQKFSDAGLENIAIGMPYKSYTIRFYANGFYHENEFLNPLAALEYAKKVLSEWHNIIVNMEKDTKKEINKAKKQQGIIG